MQEILVRAGCFLAIIVLGYVLRRTGVFGPESFSVISRMTVKLALPAAIVVSFSGKQIDPSLLILAVLGLGGGVLYITLGILSSLRSSKKKRALTSMNLAGYNIGSFTLPFAQSFLGPLGVITCSLFDVGNALVVLGGSFSVASVLQDGGRFSLKRLFRTLMQSVPFVTYMIVVPMVLLHIPFPKPVVELANIMGSSNVFLPMLMIGVGFKVEMDREHIGHIIKILSIRYAVAAVLAICFYYLLPFELQIRQALVILVFSPVTMTAPAFTGELKNDVGLSSAVNSISMIISMIIIVTLLTIML